MRLPWQRRRPPVEVPLSLPSRAKQIRALNALPLFLPIRQHALSAVVPVVALTTLGLAALYAICHRVVALHHDQLFPPDKDEEDEDKRADKDDYDERQWGSSHHHPHSSNGESSHVNSPQAHQQQQAQKQRRREQQRVHKLCYQVTNLSVNAFLGVLGCYYQYKHVPPYSAMSVADTVVGNDDFAVFAAVQIGYQLWSIPVGIFHVGESPAMLLHHFAVIMVATMSAFFTGGFRYWTPFFYGIIELSSVPLALMNMFKDRHDWIRRYPAPYTAIRLAFCATFLCVRVWWFVPRKLLYLRDHRLLWSLALSDGSRPLSYVAFMAGVWISSVFLLGLQLHWGALIVRGLLKLAAPAAAAAVPENDKDKSISTDTLKQTPLPTKTASGDAAAMHSNGTTHKQKAA